MGKGKRISKRIMTFSLVIAMMISALSLGSISKVEAEENDRKTDSTNSFEYTVNGNEITIAKYIGSSGKVVVPETIEGKKVTEIGEKTFFKCGVSIKEVQLPDSITIIGKDAFMGTKIRKITIPEGVVSIGETAFAFSELEDITIPGNVKYFGASEFYSCKNLRTVILKDGVEEISLGSFCACRNLSSIIIPDSIKKIGKEAFKNCNSIENITLSKNLESIDYMSFKWCTNLKKLIIPDSVKSIGEFAFEGCKKLKTLSLSKNLTTIGKGAFSGCESLTSLEIPKNVKSIGAGITSPYYSADGCKSMTSLKVSSNNKVYNDANGSNVIIETKSNTLIAGCTTSVIPDNIKMIADYAYVNIKKVEIPSGVTSIGGWAFHGCKNIKSVFIPDSVKKVDCRAFSGCTNLTDIRLPNGLKVLNESLFWKCNSLVEIDIPKSIKTIDLAFYECKKLKEVTIPKNVKKIDNHAFDNCNNLKVIWVDKGSYAEKWAKDNGYTVKYINDKAKPLSLPIIKSAKNLKSKRLIVKWNKIKGVKGYEVQYALNKKFTKSTKTKIVKKTTLTVKKLIRGKTYFVRVRSYEIDSKGKKNYSKWSVVKKVKIKK